MTIVVLFMDQMKGTCQQFKSNSGIESVNTPPKPGRRKTMKIPIITEHIVRCDARYSAQQIFNLIGISKGTILTIRCNML